MCIYFSWCGPEIFNGILPWGDEVTADNGRITEPTYKQKLRRGALFKKYYFVIFDFHIVLLSKNLKTLFKTILNDVNLFYFPPHTHTHTHI